RQIMRLNQWLVPAALVTTVTLLAAPVYADKDHRGEQGRSGDHRGEEGRSGGGDRGRGRVEGAPQRAQPRFERSTPAPRQEVQPARPPAVAPRAIPPTVVPRAESAPRAYATPRVPTNRGYGYAVPRYSYPGRVYVPHRPVHVVPVVPYYRPYYAFRPRFSIGFGLFVGYPIAYPYAYGVPTYVYPYPDYSALPNTSVYPSGPYPAPPPQGSYGGVSFDITPDDAAVYIDGQYVGVVHDFSPTNQPLTLAPGMHHVELEAT